MMIELIKNEFAMNQDGVWIKKTGAEIFDYSDGKWAEKYLTKAMDSSSDLSSSSLELQNYGINWASEYHLTTKRSNLFKGLDFNRDHSVLEIGCGCGAITRYLGETFKEVIAVEGSLNRAALARKRTKDLDHVAIVNSPFQDLKLENKFDAVFCIGVFEYSPSFVDVEDSFNFVLDKIQKFLKPNGYLVMAIENQFGLKYFSNSTEDHTNLHFEGIEGYPTYANKVQTFGRVDLKRQLKKRFENIETFMPFPDYKLPQALFIENVENYINIGECIGRIEDRDYSGNSKKRFDPTITWHKLGENNLIKEFTNSFLILCGNGIVPKFQNEVIGQIYTNGNNQTKMSLTRIFNNEGSITTHKEARSRSNQNNVQHISCVDNWINTPSISLNFSSLIGQHKGSSTTTIGDIKRWWQHLNSISFEKDNELYLEGIYLDATWQNSFIVDGEVKFIDLEHVYHKEIPTKIILLRAAYIWFSNNTLVNNEKTKTFRKLVRFISENLSIEISDHDINTFKRFESQLQSEIGNQSFVKVQTKIKITTSQLPISFVRSSRSTLHFFTNRVRGVFRKIFPNFMVAIEIRKRKH